MYSAFKCIGKYIFHGLEAVQLIFSIIGDLAANEYPWVCLKELCVFILEIHECAECSRTCEEQCLVQNFPDYAGRLPASRSDFYPDVSQCMGWCSSFLRKLPVREFRT